MQFDQLKRREFKEDQPWGLWRLITSGGEKYTDHEASDGSHAVRENNSFFWSTGTKIGETDSLKDSLDAVRSHSGSDDVTIRTK